MSRDRRRTVSSLVRACELLCRAFPPAFRELHGADFTLVCRDVLAEAFRDRGYFGLIIAWLAIVADIARNAVLTRAAAASRAANGLFGAAANLMLLVMPLLLLTRVLVDPETDATRLLRIVSLVVHCALMCVAAIAFGHARGGTRRVLFIASASAVMLFGRHPSAAIATVADAPALIVLGVAQLSIPVLVVLSLASLAPDLRLRQSRSG